MSIINDIAASFPSFHEGGSVAQRQLAVLVVAVHEAMWPCFKFFFIHSLRQCRLSLSTRRAQSIYQFIHLTFSDLQGNRDSICAS
jgi:hypothetical protein